MENKMVLVLEKKYEGCSNMNASSFITLSLYMLWKIVIPLWKELFVTFKLATNIKKQSLFFLELQTLI